MPGDDGATPLQESMKQDYKHIGKPQPLFQDNSLSKIYGC